MKIGRLEERVEGDAETAVHHVSDHPLEDWTGGLEAWIRVHFNQVHLEVIVNHEVVSKYLKGMMTLHWVNSSISRSKSITNDPLDLGENLLLKVYFEIRVAVIEVALEFFKGNFIAHLEFAVVICFFLHCVVGQVDQFIG